MFMRLVHPVHVRDGEEGVSVESDGSDTLMNEPLIGVSRWAVETRSAISAHAAHERPILLEGEPGSGKEFIARLIHESSPRRHGPFVCLSCESMSEESLASALFGWMRVLSSGGRRAQRGLVEAARGGTLYINGLVNLPPAIQMKLARLIEYQEFRRSGEQQLETADVRILFGTVTPLYQQSTTDSVLKQTASSTSEIIMIPSLRQRRSDIEPLARHFVRQSCERYKKELRHIAPDTINLLRTYDWPGNVGELKHVIEEMVTRSGPPYIEPAHLPSHITQHVVPHDKPLPPAGINLTEEIEQFEKALLCGALKACAGVQSRAARLLGLKLSTLNAKIMRYGIDVNTFK